MQTELPMKLQKSGEGHIVWSLSLVQMSDVNRGKYNYLLDMCVLMCQANAVRRHDPSKGSGLVLDAAKGQASKRAALIV